MARIGRETKKTKSDTEVRCDTESVVFVSNTARKNQEQSLTPSLSREIRCQSIILARKDAKR